MLNVKDLRALTWAFKWGGLLATVFSISGVEVHTYIIYSL